MVALRCIGPQSEGWTAPADNHDTLGQFDPAIHGTDGPIFVSLNGFPWSDFEGRVIQTTKELPEFPFNLDMNSGEPLGVCAFVAPSDCRSITDAREQRGCSRLSVVGSAALPPRDI